MDGFPFLTEDPQFYVLARPLYAPARPSNWSGSLPAATISAPAATAPHRPPPSPNIPSEKESLRDTVKLASVQFPTAFAIGRLALRRCNKRSSRPSSWSGDYACCPPLAVAESAVRGSCSPQIILRFRGSESNKVANTVVTFAAIFATVFFLFF